eukprot:1076723-Pelagomonas_calceolata.AAC.1
MSRLIKLLELTCKFLARWAHTSDAIAKYQACQVNNNVADTGIPSAGPGGNQFSHLFWFAKEEKKKRTQCWHIHSSCTQS